MLHRADEGGGDELFQDQANTPVLRYHDRPGGAACHCVSQQASQGVSGQQQGLAIVRIGVVGLIRCGRLLPRT